MFRGIGHLDEQDGSFQALGQFLEKKEANGETTWEFTYIPENWKKKKDAKASA